MALSAGVTRVRPVIPEADASAEVIGDLPHRPAPRQITDSLVCASTSVMTGSASALAMTNIVGGKRPMFASANSHALVNDARPIAHPELKYKEYIDGPI